MSTDDSNSDLREDEEERLRTADGNPDARDISERLIVKGEFVLGAMVEAVVIVDKEVRRVRYRPRRLSKVMRPPAAGVLALSEILFSRNFHKNVITQIVADTREEYYCALSEGRRLKAAWIGRGRIYCDLILALVTQGFFAAICGILNQLKGSGSAE